MYVALRFIKIKEKKVKKEQQVQVKVIDVKTMELDIESLSPFLSHKFSERSMAQMESKQRKQSKERKARIAIETEIEDCTHRLPNGKVAYPASAFYNGMFEAAVYVEGMKKKQVGGSVKVMGVDDNPLVEIKFKKMVIQKDSVRLGNTSDIRYRPRFEDWRCRLKIQYNAAQISPEQIVNLANLAGFHRGIGDWRPGSPKKPGSNGMYRVAATRK